MNLNLDPAQLSFEQMLKVVRQLLAENARLRAEIEELKRKNARSAAPFSKNKPKKNPGRAGRKTGQGIFRNRPAPSEEQYSPPPVELPVNETCCPGCGGELVDTGMEVVTNTELPALPAPEVKACRVHISSCSRCKSTVRGRLVPRAQAAAIRGWHPATQSTSGA